jgi:hypothetical protein
MLTRNQIESELSLAYLQAVAARVAFSVDVPRVDSDSIDAVISNRCNFQILFAAHRSTIESNDATIGKYR